MLLDPNGRPVRRSIGFIREVETEKLPSSGELANNVCGFYIPVEENEAFEECEQ